MEELSLDAVLSFLQERGGRVRNQELLERFKGSLHPAGTGTTSEEERSRARQRFKDIVNELGSVRQEEDGLKYVCLRKRYRRPSTELPPKNDTTPRTEENQPPPRISVTGATEDAEPAHSSQEDSDPGGSENKPPPFAARAAEAEPLPGDSPCALRPTATCSPVGISGRSSRETFRELLLSGASPQLRRGGFFPGAGRRAGGSSGSEADSALLASEEAPLALDPLEHAWMLSASSGSTTWEKLRALLASEPLLLTRRDFITGCSCVHWAARHGRPELLAALLGFARQAGLPVDINARSSGGYTALHMAAMHGHAEVAKMLIGAYDADVEVRDYSGRKAHHYLGPSTDEALRGLVRGEAAEVEAPPAEETDGGRWSLSRVLPSSLIVHKLLQVPEEEGADQSPGGGGVHRAKPVSRRPSGGSRPKPRLNKMRFRTQIIHTRGPEGEEDEGPLKSPAKLRPKSNKFG